LADAEGKLIEDVARDILDYFLGHPEAADSLAGIARWRLLEQTVHRSLEATESAVAWLTREGYLQEISLGGTSVFQLNRDKLAAAQKLLRPRTKPKRRKDSG